MNNFDGNAINFYSLMPRPLTYGEHAKERLADRRIKHVDVIRVIRTGKRIDEGERVVHYDLRSRIKVVVNWDTLVIVTVIRLNDKQCRMLREREQAEPPAAIAKTEGV